MPASPSGQAFWKSYLAAPALTKNQLPTLDDPVCQYVTQSQMESQLATAWRQKLGFDDTLRFHRSVWEFYYPMQALERLGMLEPGRRGLILGAEVGVQLSYVLANRGVDVGVTDFRRGTLTRASLSGQRGWVPAIYQDRFPELCPPNKYADHVRYRQIMYGALPADLIAEKYDFVCTNALIRSAETLEAALAFLPKLPQCLRPGGAIIFVADAVVNEKNAAQARNLKFLTQKDLVTLQKQMAGQGWAMRLNTHQGDGEFDQQVDEPPYASQKPHLKLRVAGLTATSVGCVLVRADQPTPSPTLAGRAASWEATKPVPSKTARATPPVAANSARMAYYYAPVLEEEQPPTLKEPVSQVCTQIQIESGLGSKWRIRLGLLENEPLHRKIWEYLYVCETLEQYDLLKPGCKGIGFGVGQEVLPYYFASQDVDLLATDLGMDEVNKAAWVDTGQHGSALQPHMFPAICSAETFNQHITYRDVNMNAIPEDLQQGQFDFSYSCCSLEHVGSIELGLQFMINSLKCLKPGGVFVHTTEYNCSSNDQTLMSGETVLFRRQDILELQRRVEELGYTMRLNLHTGDMPVDQFVDVPPYSQRRIHLKLELGQYVTTSIGITICRPPGFEAS